MTDTQPSAARKERARVSIWEHDEYVVTVDGHPVGGTMHEREAIGIARWLNGALKEIESAAVKATIEACAVECEEAGERLSGRGMVGHNATAIEVCYERAAAIRALTPNEVIK